MADTPEDSHKFQLSYSLDKGEFFRRTCPSCGLDFKTKADQADISTLLAPFISEAGMEIGEKPNIDKPKDTARLICPYCYFNDEITNFITDEFRNYLEHLVMRELVIPKLDRIFSDIFETIPKPSPRSNSLVSFSLSIEHHRDILPPRPISGPEPPDMIVARLFCCQKDIKILETWHSPISCPYCGDFLLLS